jgi:hypothetical protein
MTSFIQYVHEDKTSPRKLLSLSPTEPPNTALAIGTTTQVPPTPESFNENREFLAILHTVIRENAAQDPDVQAQAHVYASQSGSALGSGGVFFPQHQQNNRRRHSMSKQQPGNVAGRSDGSGGASSQGGMGGGGRGGYIHVSDRRNPPDYGRVAWPEDIFGSVELDASGKFVDGTGRYQESGTYRIVTREGILGLSPFLQAKLLERIKVLESQARQNA